MLYRVAVRIVPLLLGAGCGSAESIVPSSSGVEGGAKSVTYRGELPSARAQAALAELEGKLLTLEQGELAGTWTVGGFALESDPQKGVGPGVWVTRGGLRRRIPVLSNEDVADLFRRVMGIGTPLVTEGSPTDAYLSLVAPAVRTLDQDDSQR